MTALLAGDTGELEIIRRISAILPPAPPGMIGMGDDCAVVSPPENGSRLVLKSDPVIEGYHFLAEDDPRRIGHKALGRVLSDFAAMGATPRWALINLVARKNLPVFYIEEIYRGMLALATRFGVTLVGGDVSEGEALHLHVFGAGEVAPDRVLLRKGARAGDWLYVTGTLGGSRAGHHFDFEPRIHEGRWLAEKKYVTAMCDLSDGVASDSQHFARASGVGIELYADKIPLSPDIPNREDFYAAVTHALCDGEDFELLFTVPRGLADTMEQEWAETFRTPLTRIGQMTPEKTNILLAANGQKMPFPKHGFEHFDPDQTESHE